MAARALDKMCTFLTLGRRQQEKEKVGFAIFHAIPKMIRNKQNYLLYQIGCSSVQTTEDSKEDLKNEENSFHTNPWV